MKVLNSIWENWVTTHFYELPNYLLVCTVKMWSVLWVLHHKIAYTVMLCCSLTFSSSGQFGTTLISKASNIPSRKLNSVVCARLQWGHSVRAHLCGVIDKTRKMISVFVDMHSILCNLCIAIVCWRGPVYSDTVACCLSDGHLIWWVGFWNGKYQNTLHSVLSECSCQLYHSSWGCQILNW